MRDMLIGVGLAYWICFWFWWAYFDVTPLDVLREVQRLFRGAVRR